MAEFDQLTEEYDGGDDLPEDVDARLGELEALIDGYVRRPATYDPQEVARAGVFISLASNGVLRIDRGYGRRHHTDRRRPRTLCGNGPAGDPCPAGRRIAGAQ